MKKLLLLLSIVGISASVNAQEPDFNVAPNFTVTDLNGTQHDLYTYLDAGKTVVIDMFATWCGPCWNYAGHPASSTHPNFGALEDFYTQYGPNGTDEVVVIAIESDGSTGMADLQGTTSGTAGDWITGTLYPIVDDASVAPLFNLAYYPTVVMICPDRYAYEIGQSSVADFYAGVGNCPSVPTNANDPRMLGENSDEIFCAGGEATMKAVVQNYGTANATAMTIEVMDGSTTVLTKNWTGNLAMYEAEEVNLGVVSPTNATTYTIAITSANDDTSNDGVDADVAPAPSLKVDPTNKVVIADVTFDGYASEFGVVFDSGLPTQEAVPTFLDARNGVTNPLGFVEIGTYADGDATASLEMTTTVDGCHYYLFVDAYGDGLTVPTAGSISISGNASGSSSISVAGDYDDDIFVIFDVASALSVKELNNISSKLYPNPVSNQDAVLELSDVTGKVVVNINDIAGKLVSTQTVYTNGRVILPTQNLEAGVYIINISNEEGTATQKIIVE
ncbi:MAG: T9SS type A sorting domain-containing protein [Salibacteraceae bacterium]